MSPAPRALLLLEQLTPVAHFSFSSLLLLLVACLLPQPKGGNPPQAKLSTDKAAREAEAERLLKE